MNVYVRFAVELPVCAQMHMMDKSKLMEALQRLPISFGMSMGVRAKCQKVAQRYATHYQLHWISYRKLR